jgi:hypothetical protein
MKFIRFFVFIACVSNCILTAAMAQGPLAPPGPPGETMRSLAQIEPRTPIGSIPFTISQPGSYYLTGNVAGITAGAVAGIVIAARQVTLDLNGFTLTGNPAVPAHAISVAADVDNVKIFNGGLHHWGGDGVHAPEASHMALDDLVVQDCVGNGIAMASGSLGDITSQNNGGAGVFQSNPVPGIGIIVKKNPGGSSARLLHNGGGGLVLEGDCDAEFSGEIAGNTGHGISWAPILPGDGLRLRLEECDDSNNTGDGVHVASSDPVDVDCDFSSASFRHNGGDGVHIDLPHADSRLDISHVRGEVCDNGTDGLDVTAGQNGHQGFFDVAMARNGGDGCNKVDGGSNPGSFVRCVVQDNVGRGLDLVGGSWTLESSLVKNNGSDGVAIGAKKHTKTGHVTLLKRTSSVEDNQGHGVTVYPAEAGAVCDVVVENSRSTGNVGDGFHLDAGVAGSGTFRESVVQGNDGRGLDLTGGSWTLEGTAVNSNGSDGVVVAAKKEFKGHVTLLKRGGSAERNAGDGIRVQSSEPDADCSVVVENARCSGNTGDGLHVVADDAGSGGSVRVAGSSISGNGKSGIAIGSVVGSAGLAYKVEDADCGGNTDDGISIMDPRVTGGTVSRTRLSGNGDNGISVEGGMLTLEACEIRRNGGDGVVLAAKKHTKTGHVSLLKRGGASEDNAGNGVRVYAIEADAECRVIVQDSSCSGNSSNGLHVASAPPGSSITLDWLDSTASGNGGSGMLINPIAMDKGLRFRAEGGACDGNVAGGLTVEGDAVDVCTVRGLSLRGNGKSGARAAGGSWLFAECTATDNTEGGFRMHKPMAIYKRTGSFSFQDCEALGNGLAGIAVYGFDSASTARVDIAGGRVAANAGVGIDLSSSPGTKGRIHGVAVSDNAGHGIYSEGRDWSITDNRVAGNANTGIFVEGDSNHLARNELTGNALGIFMAGNANAARENTFSGMVPAGGALQDPYIDNTGANLVAPVQDVPAGVNPLGNVRF